MIRPRQLIHEIHRRSLWQVLGIYMVGSWFVLQVVDTMVGAEMIAGSAALAQQPEDWRQDWAVAEGFSLEIDSRGFNLPTAIAVIPSPGDGPKDPVYFVTEIGGAIKAVTNDRSVVTFAQDFMRRDVRVELPHLQGETGMAGICLAPEQGYVFATYTYLAEGGVLRNSIARFKSRPGTFGTSAEDVAILSDIFAADTTAISHQIGPCQVRKSQLFVSVGDGRRAPRSRELSSTLGKILTMDLDGNPIPGSPFYQDSERTKPANYVWSRGHRNPFSLSRAGDDLFVAENGISIDRFMRVEAGRDYGWDGTDWSLSANADFIFAPAVGPVQMDFHAAGRGLLPDEFGDVFLISTSGTIGTPGPSDTKGGKTILALQYDFPEMAVAGPPRVILQFVGAGHQAMVGLAIGADAVYAVPLFPMPSGESVVLRLRYDPENAFANTLGQVDDAEFVMVEKSCRGCHVIAGAGSDLGPDLDPETLIARLGERLLSDDYLAWLDELDASENPQLVAGRPARDAVRAVDGEERIRVWVEQLLLNPGFDMPGTQMPNLGLSAKAAAAVAVHLTTVELPPEEPNAVVEFIARGDIPYLRVPESPGEARILVLVSFALGVIGTGVMMLLAGRYFRRRR